MATSTDRIPAERRRDVDFTRALLVFGLILFHTARIFDVLPFYVKNDEQSLAFMVLVGFVSQWGMPLFFVIAGFAAYHSLARRTAGGFVMDRIRRLMVPFVFGILVLVPPQHYYSLRTNPEYHDSYWQFYPSFFRVVFRLDFPEFIRADPAVGVFGPAHLWFLYYLFAFSIVSLPLFVYFGKGSGQRFVSRLASLSARRGGIFLLALPVIAVETLVMTEETTGWNRFAYIPFLVCGYLFAADPRFEQSLRKYRNIGVVGGVITVLAFFWISVRTYQAGIDPSRGFLLESVLWRLLKSCSSYLWIVAILGWAQNFESRHKKHLSDGAVVDSSTKVAWLSIRARNFINEAVMPFYIIHQTLIVVFGFYIVKLRAGLVIKYVLIVAATFLATLFIYAAVRRVSVTRFLFGMKPAARMEIAS